MKDSGLENRMEKISPRRAWKWFGRLFEVWYSGCRPHPSDYWCHELFRAWSSGYKCRQLDEEDERRRARGREGGESNQ